MSDPKPPEQRGWLMDNALAMNRCADDPTGVNGAFKELLERLNTAESLQRSATNVLADVCAHRDAYAKRVGELEEERDRAVRAFHGLWEKAGDLIACAKDSTRNPWFGEDPVVKHLREMERIAKTGAALFPVELETCSKCHNERAVSPHGDDIRGCENVSYIKGFPVCACDAVPCPACRGKEGAR